MAKAKRSYIQREEDLVVITEHWNRGLSERASAEELAAVREYSLSRVTINRDRKTVLKRLQDQQLKTVAEVVAREESKLDYLERVTHTYLEAARVSKSGQDHRPRYLDILLKIHTARVKLRGATAPVKVEVSWRDQVRALGIDPQHILERMVDVIDGEFKPVPGGDGRPARGGDGTGPDAAVGALPPPTVDT